MIFSMRNKFSCIEKKYCDAACADFTIRNELFIHEIEGLCASQSPLAITGLPTMRFGWIS
jgi:hypothetical protein